MAPKTTRTDPVNSEQLEAREVPAAVAAAIAASPTGGELEERTVEAENRAEAAERENATLRGEMDILKSQIAQLMRAARSPQVRADRDEDSTGPEPGTPIFEEDRPHGIIYGDAEVAYEQDGHQFGRDRSYVRTLKHHGAGRPFNPRLVGLVKPRPGQTLGDALDGIRDTRDR